MLLSFGSLAFGELVSGFGVGDDDSASGAPFAAPVTGRGVATLEDAAEGSADGKTFWASAAGRTV